MLKETPKFIAHHYVKRMQATFYKSLQVAVPSSPQRLLLQVDFAENYLCSSQDAIQAAYYHQSQVTVFTAVLWRAEKTESCIIVSDNLKHDKSTVVAYLIILLRILLRDSFHNSHLVVFSDGPCSQFKNKFILATLPHLRQHFHLDSLEWSFFAASHGKGPCDGVGGHAKRMVREAVNRRQITSVSNAKDFAEAMKKAKSSIQVCLL
jgi:hypothetical protein